MEKEANEKTGFSLLEMKVRDGEETTKVIFMGRWLSDSFSTPSAGHPQGIRYHVAFTPTNSFFVFLEPVEAPERCRYERYDSFEWMAQSDEVPSCILDAIASALGRGDAREDTALEA